MKNSLGSRLRELRGVSSQSEFSRKIGVKQTSYSCWESDLKVPAATVIAKISSTLGVSSDWILGVTDDRAGHCAPTGDSDKSRRVVELERELERLRAEISGLKYALDSFSKGVASDSAPATKRAIGA